jgi:hypothetical protein
VDLCIDLAIARKVVRTVTVGEGEEQQEVAVDFPDNGSGHDFILRTVAYECFRALQATNGVWADLWRELWLRGDPEALGRWERGTASDKGVRLGILRYVLKLEVLEDPTPGEALEADGLWDRVLTAMEAKEDLADKARLWRQLIAAPALPDWRQKQAELGLSLIGVRSSGIAPIEGSEQPAGEGASVVATEIQVEDQDHRSDVITVPDDEPATLQEGTADPATLIEPEDDE